MVKKILLITSGQPSLNPRLVKEADALQQAGYDVTVLFQYWNAWGTQLDQSLLSKKKWKAILIGGNPNKDTLIYFITRLIQKISIFLFRKTGLYLFCDKAIARGSSLLVWKAKNIKADFYLGHNLGALSAVVHASRYHNKPCGFDAEDFHRHEVENDTGNIDVLLKKQIEDKYFPSLNYLTTASPLITEAYKKLYPALTIHTILNVFPKRNCAAFSGCKSKSLKLFWFSQTIGMDRGLENIIEAMGSLPALNIELNLLGNVSDSAKEKFKLLARNVNTEWDRIRFFKPIDPDAIPVFASQFDVGLAAEIRVPYNRDICLTNKIFTYMQAGLAIMASDTLAQKQLMDRHHNIGLVYQSQNTYQIINILRRYWEEPDLLKNHKNASCTLAMNEFNWEQESRKFVALVETQLN